MLKRSRGVCVQKHRQCLAFPAFPFRVDAVLGVVVPENQILHRLVKSLARFLCARSLCSCLFGSGIGNRNRNRNRRHCPGIQLCIPRHISGIGLAWFRLIPTLTSFLPLGCREDFLLPSFLNHAWIRPPAWFNNGKLLEQLISAAGPFVFAHSSPPAQAVIVVRQIAVTLRKPSCAEQECVGANLLQVHSLYIGRAHKIGWIEPKSWRFQLIPS